MTAAPEGRPPAGRAILPWTATDPWFCGLLLVLVVLLAYVFTVFRGTFHFDDFHNAVQNPAVTSLANVPRFFTDASTWSAEPGNVMYRPLLITSYALDHALWGFRANGWLLTNVLLHAAVAVLTWRLAARLGLGPLASFLAGLVAALHPAHSEVVNYVSSRSESLAAVLMLGALHAHLAARRRDGASSAPWFAAALLLSGASLLAKETTALFFLAVAWMELVVPRDRALGGRVVRAAGAAALYGAVFAGVMLVRGAVLKHATAPVPVFATPDGADPLAGGTISILDNVLWTQSRVVVLYAQVLLRPVALNVDHDVVRTAEPSLAAGVALALHAAVVVWALAEGRRGRRLLPLCVGWGWLFLAPSVAYPLNVVMNEHRLYLPGIAVALLAGAALGRVGEILAVRRGAATGAVAALLPFACFLAADLQRSLEWRDDRVLWSVAVERAPASARAHMHLGAALHAAYDRDEGGVELLRDAIAEYHVAETLFPGHYDTQLNLVTAYLSLGRLTKDPRDFEAAHAAAVKAGRIVGLDAPRPRYYRATALAELGLYDEAVRLMRELQAADASRTTLYDDFVARVLRRKGDRDGAREAMERVIAIERDDGRVDGLLTLGWWHFEDGDADAAERRIAQAIDLVNERRVREFRPYLYAAAMLRRMGQPVPETFLRNAEFLGWAAPAEEVRWIDGGPTPGTLRLGTRGVPTYGSLR